MKFDKIATDKWASLSTLTTKTYTCGNCGDKVAGHLGYYNQQYQHNDIYICPSCGIPTYFQYTKQTPGALMGRDVVNLPVDISSIYDEIRDSIMSSNYTAAVLLGRKLIMHLAVDVAGAEEGKTFVQYIEYLKGSNYIPPNAEGLLDFLREQGNEKNHEIKLGTVEEAKKIIKFIESLLYFIYELGESEIKDEV